MHRKTDQMKLFILAIFTGFFSIANGQPSVNELLDYAIEYTESGKYTEAINVCDKLLEVIPENAEVHYLRGINYYLLKEYEYAILDFDTTLQINPQHMDAFLYRAKSKKSLKDYTGALSDYNKARNESLSKTISSLAGDMIRSIFSGD